ncbi:hypothetical protein, partial [Mycobacterium avium]
KTTREEFLSTQRVGSDGVNRERTGAAGCIPLPAGQPDLHPITSGPASAQSLPPARAAPSGNHSDGASTTKSFVSS